MSIKKLTTSIIIILTTYSALSCVSNRPQRKPNRPVDCNLDIQVTIGAFLSFRVGSNSGLKESILFDLTDAPSPNNSTFNQINFKGVPGQPNIITGVSNIGRPNFVEVEILSNKGKVIITATATALANTSGNTIPLSKITGQSLLGIISHPIINSGKSIKTSCTSFVSVSNCVTQRQDFWQYLYTNDTSPPAGTYKSTITYKASTP